MGNLAVQAQGLGKRYRLGQTKGMGAGRRAASDEFWALKDVSFDIEHGEVVGIIGGNGAGKSTLLKILSRITEPTAGYAEIHGRVGSLLEVGTGFHPDLTGRENIYLNGAILGMKRTDIRRTFDEIVAFAEIEKFIDTPVKRYSSGMYVRLAFAVAAHLQPEILVVDEVLAVGDAAFQKKCLGKMGEAAGNGRTVLFVSHNMAAIKSLCNRAILFEQGRIQQQGTTAQVTDAYLAQGMGFQAAHIAFPEDPQLGIQFLDVELIDGVDADNRDVVQFKCRYAVHAPTDNVLLCVEVRNGADICVFYTNDQQLEDPAKRQSGTHTASLTIPRHLLAPGDYFVSFGFWEPGHSPEHFPDTRLTFRRNEPITRLSAHGISWPGMLYLPADWHYGE